MGPTGWIKLHRQILDHDLWTGETFSRGQAWCDLLLMAGHQARKQLVGGQWVDLQPGEAVISKRWLQGRWRWGQKKLNSFLALLVAEGMLTVATYRGGDGKGHTRLFVQNWNHYQGNGTAQTRIRSKPPFPPQKSIFGKTEEAPYLMPTSEDGGNDEEHSGHIRGLTFKKRKECKEQGNGFLTEDYEDILDSLNYPLPITNH